MREISDKSCRGNQNTHFVLNNVFFFLNKLCCICLYLEFFSHDQDFKNGHAFLKLFGGGFQVRQNGTIDQLHVTPNEFGVLVE